MEIQLDGGKRISVELHYNIVSGDWLFIEILENLPHPTEEELQHQSDLVP